MYNVLGFQRALGVSLIWRLCVQNDKTSALQPKASDQN